MRMGQFLRQLNRVIAEDRLIEPEDGVVLAVSGGPDSMALMHAMAGVRQAYGATWRLHVAHLNHMTRGAESDAEARGQAIRAERFRGGALVERAAVAHQNGAIGGIRREGRVMRAEDDRPSGSG